jgi:ribosome biogenesis protein UTP30
LNVREFCQVVDLSKLRKKYKAFEVKRQLCNSYQVFLADERILPMLPKNLGKSFFSRNK